MKLPDNAVGISDLLAYRECERRMSFGMRRHVGRGEQSDARMPEAAVAGAVWARAYGSAVHEVLSAVEDGYDDEGAIQQAWDRYGRYLEPEDLQLLRDDLAIYRTRDFPNTRTVAAEDDMRVPLLVHDGEQIYFRFKLDRLYERLDRPGTFVHVDYKSSKWAKSQLEVHADLQLWSYNWGIHELFPECEELHQFYDQLRYGMEPTRKSDAQRAEIKDWLVKQTTAVLKNEDWQPDELLPHSYNEWCPWCPILESCPVVPELTEWSLARIAALAPEQPKKKADGSDSKLMKPVPLDPERIHDYTAELPKVGRARQVLERYEKSVKDVLRDMPPERRLQAGYDLRPRNNNVWGPQALQALHERLGDRFFELAKITKSGLESNLVEDEQLLEWALALAERRAGAPSVVPRKEAA